MKYTWDNIEHKNWDAATKYKVFLWILGIVFGTIGLILWSIIQIWTLKTLNWMICFIGGSVITSCFVAFLYTCNRDFHDGHNQKMPGQSFQPSRHQF